MKDRFCPKCGYNVFDFDAISLEDNVYCENVKCDWFGNKSDATIKTEFLWANHLLFPFGDPDIINKFMTGFISMLDNSDYIENHRYVKEDSFYKIETKTDLFAGLTFLDYIQNYWDNNEDICFIYNYEILNMKDHPAVYCFHNKQEFFIPIGKDVVFNISEQGTLLLPYLKRTYYKFAIDYIEKNKGKTIDEMCSEIGTIYYN